jgi:hypothetical protein
LIVVGPEAPWLGEELAQCIGRVGGVGDRQSGLSESAVTKQFVG